MIVLPALCWMLSERVVAAEQQQDSQFVAEVTPVHAFTALTTSIRPYRKPLSNRRTMLTFQVRYQSNTFRR
jgi:hypothetical protein